MKLSDYVELNPRVPLVKGETVPFVAMDAVTESLGASGGAAASYRFGLEIRAGRYAFRSNHTLFRKRQDIAVCRCLSRHGLD